MRDEISSGIVVYRESGGKRTYLLLGRQEGFLDFPKGHIEDGETEREAAIRETLEETGLEINPAEGFRHEMDYWFRAPAMSAGERELSVSEYAKTRTGGELIHKRLVMFLGRAPEGASPKVSIEHTGVEWLNYDQCTRMLKYRNQRELLEAVEKFLGGTGAGS